MRRMDPAHQPYAQRPVPAPQRPLARVAQVRVAGLLAQAEVVVNGDAPWDLQVHDERLYSQTLLRGSLGFGEAYMDGWWDCADLPELFCRLVRARLGARVSPLVTAAFSLDSHLFNHQGKRRAFEIGQYHYDIGNDLYTAMLDRRMIYSCAYWGSRAQTLDEAQEAKLELIGHKLDLRPGMAVLDIGCGWGGTAQYLAERFGVTVVGVTVSAEQARLASERCRGLPVEIRLQDYRRVRGVFDRVLSVGMFEHVGYRNYQTFMEVARRCLVPDGLLLLQTIGANVAYSGRDAWIERYVFPNSVLPSPRLLSAAIEGHFVLEDWQNFGADYERTLRCWHANIEGAWEHLGDCYPERFRRMWRYYLLSCAGTFRARVNQLWQLVLSPAGVGGGYCPRR
ncbi:MAG: cyclopropane fatty acyl phospholipid synthase [Chloroflexales bacterium]|nr:cyclopropane fatty acyl phospholipid synthase [Chloroflexales bacterium]